MTGCDRIFVLSDGRIAEPGGHEELVRQQGVYAGMLQSHR